MTEDRPPRAVPRVQAAPRARRAVLPERWHPADRRPAARDDVPTPHRRRSAADLARDRAAGADRQPLPPRRRARRRRHGQGLPGHRPDPGARGGRQAHQPRFAQRNRVRLALSARGEDRQPADRPAHRRRPRFRPRRRARPLPGDGIPARAVAARAALAPNGPLPLKAGLQLAGQLLLALIHAHSKNVVHRDIKPDNIFLLNQSGVRLHIRVLDFGIARIFPRRRASQRRDDHQAGAVLGTPRYMSPEQLAGQPLDARSDLYKWPRDGDPRNRCTGQLPYVSGQTFCGLCPDATPAFQDLLDRCLRPNPNERPIGKRPGGLPAAAGTRESQRRRAVAAGRARS